MRSVLCLLVILIICNACLYKRHPVKTTWSDISAKPNTQDIDSLSQRLLSQLSLKEKLDQMTGEKHLKGLVKLGANFMVLKRFPHLYSGRNKRLGIPPFSFSDGPRGATVGGHQNTIFPVAMARGATWNRNLEAQVADVIGKEIRANGGNYSGTPCINLLRHPAWGRAQETYGEDPYLLGELGLAYVNALQQHHVMACPKHFALNSIENARFYVDVQVEERALREVYLPHFKKVIQKGKAASVMSAYNKVRGEWCGESDYLLDTILRKDWNFEGFVSSDWVWGLHDGAEGIKAGMDVEMPVKNKYQIGKVKKAFNSKKINESDLDKMVLRILKTKLKFALAEDKMAYPKTLKAQASHVKLSQQVAEEAMVLLKNEGVLPFLLAKGEGIAVIGKLANSKHTGDHGSSSLRNKDVISPYEGIKDYVEGFGGQAILDEGKDLEASKALAKKADKVVLIVGYDYKDEGEYLINKTKNEADALKKSHKKSKGGDRLNLELSVQDQALINTLAPLNKNTVVVYIGGSAIRVSSWEQQTPALLFAWYSGMRGGYALANILFGAANPSGKLPFSIPKKASDLPHFNPFADTANYGYYHGYTLLEKQKTKAAYPFGFGLSYTSFRFDQFKILNKTVSKTDSLQIEVEVSNTGTRAGAEVCQLYIGFQQSKIDRPNKLLRGFQKIYLEVGEKRILRFSVPPQDLAYYNVQKKTWEIEAMEYEIYVGNSSNPYALMQDRFLVVE